MENLNEIIIALKNKTKIEYIEVTGSEKQVLWATKLKKQAIAGSIDDIMEEVLDYGWDDDDVLEEIKDFADLVNETSAAIIIEWHRQ